MKLSERVRRVKPSATMAVTEKAAELRARGVEVVDFGAGEPDFDTPEHIKRAAWRALEAGATKYTPVGGTRELKEAIVTKLRRDNGLEYAPSEVMAHCGGKHALYVAFQALFEDGDEVLLPAPYWVSYPDMLALAGARARILPTRVEEGFKLSAEALREAIGPGTRALVWNSPSNPAGVTYSEEELAAIARVLVESELFLVSDDVYEMMVYDGERPPHLLRIAPELRERTLVVNSVSKTYAMTGWRVGYSAGPRELLAAMSKLQGQMTSNPSAVAQAAAAEALSGPQDCVGKMMAEFARRRDFIVERLRSIPGIRCPKPGGAFYVFPDCSAYMGRRWKGGEIRSGEDLALYLLEEAGVAVVGGTDFGYPTHIRISYATSRENLARGTDAMARALGRLS
ncbi:MAG: aminotransferase [Candidatus Binatia bacterium]|nr:MAG: aminotransferase [Candidatus Binatia bacterium]